MKQVKQLAVIALLTPLFAACANPPANSIVEALIIAQYEHSDRIVEEAAANAGDDKAANAMSNMMTSMMPKLERIENIDCDTTDDSNIYVCTADITQTIAGTRRIDKTRFRLSQVNDEWVLLN